MAIKGIEERKVKNLTTDDYRTIDFIQIDELRTFTLKALEKHGTVEKLKEANQVADLVKGLLIHKRLLDEYTHQSFVDIMLSAALLHNLFYDENDWTTLFHARRDLTPLAEELKINSQALDALFHTIEGQLGDRTPVTECIPKPGTPTELFSYAVWLNKNRNI